MTAMETFWETDEEKAAAQRMMVALEEWRSAGGTLNEVMTALKVLVRGARVHKLYQLIGSRILLEVDPVPVQTDCGWRMFVRINNMQQPVVIRPDQSLRVGISPHGAIEVHLVTPAEE